MTTQPQQALQLPAARLSRVTISRLFSTGDYSHARYEFTVEVPPGCDPARVIADLDEKMEQLNPRPPVAPIDLQDAVRLLKQPAPPEPTAEQMAAHNGDDDPWGDGPMETYRRMMAARAEASERIAEHELWTARRAKALAAFSAFSGLGTGSQVSVMDLGPLEEISA